MCTYFRATHRPIGLSVRLILQAELITLHLHCALITAPPLVHHSPAGIGLLTHTHIQQTTFSPSDASRPRFSAPSSPQAESPPAPRLPTLFYFSFLQVHARRSDNVVDFPLLRSYFPHLFFYLHVLVLTSHYLLPLLQCSFSSDPVSSQF